MKSLMLFLAIGLAASEKLDRTYLPPPGSKFAGGEPGDLQVPLEFPKESYTTTLPFRPGHKEYESSSFDVTRLVPGTQRTGIRPSTEIIPVTPSNKPLFNLYQTKVPTTTTSYAFTQTTTFPPAEGFETTPSPIFPSDGSLGDQTFIHQQPFNQGQIYNQQTGQILPGLGTTAPGGQSINSRPGYSQAQNINQYQPGLPVSTISPIPVTGFQTGLVTPSPYDQVYSQHLGVQPPRQFNQYGSTLSTTAAPSYQTDFPSQYNDNVASIQGTKFIGKQSSVTPTSGPQKSTTQYIDKYGNVQNAFVPGFTAPQQIQPGQDRLPQTGLTQIGGDIDSIPGIYSSKSSPLGSPITTNVPQGITTTSITPGQRTENTQQDVYQTSSLSQGTNAPGTQENQFGGQQGAYLPTTSSQGLITSGQGYQQPQSVLQQSNFPTATLRPEFGSQGLNPAIASQQQQGGQLPNIIGQQGLYPSNFVLGQGPGNLQSGKPQIIGQQETILPNQITYQQPQTVGQQGSVSPGQITYQQTEGQPQIVGQPGFVPGQKIYQQPGKLPQIIGQQGYPLTSVSKTPQFIRQQGSNIPSQTTYQQPGIQQPQIISQQIPITPAINNQGSTISGQNNFQQPQLNQQTFPTTGIPNNVLSIPTGTQSDITQGSPGQQTIIGNLPSTKPFGQPQKADGRILSQPNFTARPGQQNVFTGSQQNVYGPSSPSTTPGSVASYGTTPESLYPSSTPLYPGSELDNVYSSNVNPRPERPQAESDRNAVILNYENELTPDGYAYTFDTSNGIHADENGTAIDGVKADGSFSYIGDDGKLYSVVYTADEYGFRPHGDHLPTPPPIPKAIQKVIEQAAKDRESGITHDGFYDEAKYGHHKYQKPKYRRPKPENNITNGEVIPDDYDNGDDKGKHDNGSINEDDKGTFAENDEMRTKNDNDRFLMNTSIKMQYQSDKKNLSRRPTKKPEKFEYGNNKDKDQITNVSEKPQKHISGQTKHDRKPYTSSQDTPRRRPNIPGRIGEPISFSDEPEQEGYDEENVNLSKVSGNKYPAFEENDQHVGSPGYFDSKEQNMRRIPQGSNKQSTYRPIKPIGGPSKIFETKYNIANKRPEEQQFYDKTYIPDEKDQLIVGRPVGANKNELSNNRNDFTYKQKPSSDAQYNVDNTNYPTDIRHKQNFEPSYEEHSEQNKVEQTGYQYTPPETKFEQGTDKFPSRFSDKATPSTGIKTSDRKTTIQPFITPNVQRGEDVSYEDIQEENIFLKESDESPEKDTTTIPEYETTDNDSSQFFENKSGPGKYNQKSNVTSTNIRPAAGSKNKPDYTSQPITENYGAYMTESEGDSPSNGSTKSGQKNEGRYSSNSQKQNTQSKPGQNYLQRPKGTTKSPSFTYTSSTTSMPFRKTYRPDSKKPSQQEQFQYSTTYEPSDSSSPEEEYTEESFEPGLSSSKPNSRRPVAVPGGFYGTTTGPKVRPGSTEGSSKTTSRPSYDYLENTGISSSPTVRPGTSESALRKPIRPSSSNKPSYSTTVTQTSTSSQRRPGASIIENYDNIPGSDISESHRPEIAKYPDTSVPGLMLPSRSQKIGQAGRQDLPSTTYRPNYSITDISQPGSVTVDTFGRPIESTGAPGRPGTTRPIFSSPGQLTSDGQSTNYQDSGVTRPEQATTFKPTEPRFGTSQGAVGLKPAEFGPSSFTTPGYLSPYSPSSGKVIGEDFSGPKQPQKFDPETGYYY